jgi:hypothetical protein
LIARIKYENTPLAKINVSGNAAGLYLVRIYGQNTKPASTPIIIRN